MSLQIVYGSSGIGKSYKMYKDVIALACKDDKESYQIIVPEQFTMETQKLIVKMHPGQGVMNIDASSFVRLAYRVFDENGREVSKFEGEISYESTPQFETNPAVQAAHRSSSGRRR